MGRRRGVEAGRRAGGEGGSVGNASKRINVHWAYLLRPTAPPPPPAILFPPAKVFYLRAILPLFPSQISPPIRRLSAPLHGHCKAAEAEAVATAAVPWECTIAVEV